MSSSDADLGYALTTNNQRFRGHGATIAANLIAATPPPPELVAHHRAFGLGPTRIVCPAEPSVRATLAELVLADTDLVARLRADRSLRRIVVSFKSASAARLIAALGLTPVYCDPAPEVYELANDKLGLARAGRRYGFDTLPTEVVSDDATLAASFRSLSARYGEGCILRLRRGASGRHIHHARTLRAARRLWRQLGARSSDVLLLPYVPATVIGRNVATHGLVTADGFAPFLFTDQIVRRHAFRGGHTLDPWSPTEIAAIRTGLAGVGRWFRDLGYTGAPASIDGFLLHEADGPRFVLLDPNARMSGTMGPWAAITVLTERAGQSLLWCFEGSRLYGIPLTFDRLCRRLGSDLLAPGAIERGGVLPTFFAPRRRGPIGATDLSAILVGRDASHVEHLRRHVRSLGLIAR